MQTTKTKTLIRYVLPSILSSSCYFLFTIIDGIFIGRGVGTDGLGAINILFPFIMIANSLFLLTGIGGVSVMAVRMGRGDIEGANKAFLHSLTLTGIVAVILALIGTVFVKPLTILLGGSDPAFFDLCVEYTFMYSLFIIPSGLSMAMQNYCRNDGAPILVSLATIIGTILNIFGDWIFIFPLKMGMKGAALATGLSQTVTFLIVISHFVFKKGKLRFKRFKIERELVGKIFLRGMPECIAQFSVPIATICMNYVLLDLHGVLGVNTYSLLAYVASFSVAVFAGTAQGLQPLFGQSFGACQRKDLSFFLRSGIIINLVGSILINYILPFVSYDVCALFGADEVTLNNAVKYISYFSWGFIAESMNSILSAYLYSTKRSKEAIFTNILRSFVFSTLVTLALPYIWKADYAVWMTFGIYQSLVMICGIIITVRSDKKLSI
jgi:putative MATE family efflux protein